LGVDGDTVCNGRLHGGVDQAVYAYGIEDARWWQEELGPALNHTLRAGSFGENLTTSGLDLTGAIIGERWQIGTAVLEVSVPRTPCRTFASFWKVPHLIRRFTAAARPGSYLRVLTPGLVRAGDVIEVVERPAHGLTVGETFRAMTGDRELAWKLLTAPQLPDSVLRQAHIWLTETA
jgi:MOSC domain-containing protein YiiM